MNEIKRKSTTTTAIDAFSRNELFIQIKTQKMVNVIEWIQSNYHESMFYSLPSRLCVILV